MIRFDDPLLSMILRFISSENSLEQTGKIFIERQFSDLKKYVSQFPKADEEKMALAWIGKYAREYRRNWEQKIASAYGCKTQCADCPMILKGQTKHCVIHQKWIELLDAYCHDAISTKAYIENALTLLQKHKDDLNITNPKNDQDPQTRSSLTVE